VAAANEIAADVANSSWKRRGGKVAMNYIQQPLIFECNNESLLAIISRPEQPRSRGVVIVVGGPQYRVGSHRQFVLLANHLAQRGTPVMRFDYRGLGDSTGQLWSSSDPVGELEELTHDIGVAIDAFFKSVEELHDVVIWGLCGAASAALFYAYRDPRVSGIALLNPWVRTVKSEAKAYLRHYYTQRLISPAFWRKLLRGQLNLWRSAKSFDGNIRRAISGGSIARRSNSTIIQPAHDAAVAQSLPERMADGLARFHGRVLLILSGNDLTANEFSDVSGASKQWRQLLASPRVTRYVLPDATHTFSRHDWRHQVAAWTANWVQSW